MANFPQPTTPTVNQIATTDFINYQGVQYPVASVVSTSYTSPVINSAIITITVNSQTVTLSLTSADTILQDQHIFADQSVHNNWKQTAVYT